MPLCGSARATIRTGPLLRSSSRAVGAGAGTSCSRASGTTAHEVVSMPCPAGSRGMNGPTAATRPGRCSRLCCRDASVRGTWTISAVAVPGAPD